MPPAAPLLLALAVSTLAQLTAAAHLPSEYPVCKRSDPNLAECLKNAFGVVLKHLPGGIPSLGVVPIDPLDVPFIEINEGNGNLNLKISFKDVRVTGLTKANISSVIADLAANKMSLFGVEPHLELTADYKMDGKFLVVPVQGSGKCKFVFTDLESKLALEAERVQKDGQEFWDVKRFPLDIHKLGGLQISFQNLFNGDPNLGPSFNRLLNENWQAFWSALRPTFEEAFGLLFLDFTRKVFEKVPLDEVFPK